MSDTKNNQFNNNESVESIDLLKDRIKLLEKEIHELKNQGRYKRFEYKYQNEDRLRPPAYIPTEKDILLAKAKYAMEEEVYQIIHDMIKYIDLLEGSHLSPPYNEENIRKYYKIAMKKWNNAMDKWSDDKELFEALVDENWFKKCYIDGLEDIHMGDCTAFATSCMRCHAESMFKIPMTANWGKHEGYKLFSQYAEDIKEKKEKE